MRLNANDPLLGYAPEKFESPFPSDDALLDARFNALMKGVDAASPNAATQGTRIMAQAQAQAWRLALSMCNRAKVTIVGDLPSAWLPEVARFEPLRPGVEALAGLWAQVAFPQSSDPEALALAVANVGLDVALDFLGAVPIVGALMKWVLNLGSMLGKLFASPDPQPVKELFLPWTEYKLRTDEDFVQKFLIDKFFASVDWTGIFMPPYQAGVPWRVANGVRDGREMGTMWAPIKKGQNVPAFSNEGIGAMPGTFRMAGLIQSPKLPQADPRLLRYFGDGTMLHWGKTLIDTGDFYPATAQTSTLAWQQAERVGSPDMYKIDCAKVEKAWTEYWDQFFDSLWFEFKNDEWVGEFAAPYLAVEGAEWRLGLRNPNRANSPQLQRPHPAPLITPTIFTKGAGTTATRNKCLYWETRSGPTGGLPKGHQGNNAGEAVPYIRDKNGHALASGGPGWPPNKKMPASLRCVPWPDGEELLVNYKRPDVAIITPAVKRLAARQKWCLKHTLVAAYVRCDGPDAYAAFKADPELAALCRDVRAKLLVNDARFAVRLADVADIDPDFEKKLRKAGVTNAPSQMQFALTGKKAQGAEVEADPASPAIGPQGGLPFEEPKKRGSGGGGGGLLLGLAGAGLAVGIGVAATRGTRVRR